MAFGQDTNEEPVWAPTTTQVVGPGGAVLLTIDGTLLLPVGAGVHLPGGGSATVTGVRLDASAPGFPMLILDVDGGGSSVEAAAIDEAEAEAEVVEAATAIAGAGRQVDPTG